MMEKIDSSSSESNTSLQEQDYHKEMKPALSKYLKIKMKTHKKMAFLSFFGLEMDQTSSKLIKNFIRSLKINLESEKISKKCVKRITKSIIKLLVLERNHILVETDMEKLFELKKVVWLICDCFLRILQPNSRNLMPGQKGTLDRLETLLMSFYKLLYQLSESYLTEKNHKKLVKALDIINYSEFIRNLFETSNKKQILIRRKIERDIEEILDKGLI